MRLRHHYHRYQKSELAWIPNAIRAIGLARDATGDGHLPLALKHWVQEQRSYFRFASERDRKQLLLLREIGNGCLIAGLFRAVIEVIRRPPAVHPAVLVPVGLLAVVAAVHAFVKVQDVRRRVQMDGAAIATPSGVGFLLGITSGLALTWLVPMTPGLIPSLRSAAVTPEKLRLLALGLTAVVAALLHGYAEKRALSEHAKHYTWMSNLFADFQGRLQPAVDAGRNDEARALIEELGKEALEENGEWVLLHRDRPLELPKSA